jgi:hypothetical protein
MTPHATVAAKWIQDPAPRRLMRCRTLAPTGRPDRDDEHGRDEERPTNHRRVRAIVIAAEIPGRLRRIKEEQILLKIPTEECNTGHTVT